MTKAVIVQRPIDLTSGIVSSQRPEVYRVTLRARGKRSYNRRNAKPAAATFAEGI
jgi:hypothetical protein